ncbi:MAG: hypothetical protein ACI9G1_004889, partial [Pirellulaceae bacterium]
VTGSQTVTERLGTTITTPTNMFRQYRTVH